MLSIQKVNIATLYNRNEEYNSCTDREVGSKIQKFKDKLHQNIIPINEYLHIIKNVVNLKLDQDYLILYKQKNKTILSYVSSLLFLFQ